MLDRLLRTGILHRLDRLRITPRRALPGPTHGDLRSVRQGTSLEFADYREYHPGDDERRIDWHVAARTDEFYVRLFQGEENLRFEVLIDQSASMGFGEPSKLAYATSVAAALGYVALRGGHKVQVMSFADGLVQHASLLRGRQSIVQLFKLLSALTPQGGTSIKASLERRGHQQPLPGLTVILSDLYDTQGLQYGIDALRSTGREVQVVHTLTPEELNPPSEGAYDWVDSETAERLQITLDADTIHLYTTELNRWVREIRSFCSARRVHYLQVATDTPVEEFLFLTLRKEGLLH